MMDGRRLKNGLRSQTCFTLGCIIVCVIGQVAEAGVRKAKQFQAVDWCRRTGIIKSATFERCFWLVKP